MDKSTADFFDQDFWRVSEPLLHVDQRKMAFICSKGNLDMAYPALVMSIAALTEKVDVNIFFTFWGLDIVTKRTMDSLKFTMQGNTALHLPLLEKIRPGWGKRYMPPSLGNLPGATHLATWYMNKMMEKNGIPPVRDLLEQIVEMGGHLWGCKMTVDLMELRQNMMYKGVSGIITAPEFIKKSEGAQIIFIQSRLLSTLAGTGMVSRDACLRVKDNRTWGEVFRSPGNRGLFQDFFRGTGQQFSRVSFRCRPPQRFQGSQENLLVRPPQGVQFGTGHRFISLGQALPLRIHDQRHMSITGWAASQRFGEPGLHRSAGGQISPPHNLIYALIHVVHHHDQLISPIPIGTPQHEIMEQAGQRSQQGIVYRIFHSLRSPESQGRFAALRCRGGSFFHPL